jgi:hypothetical protein
VIAAHGSLLVGLLTLAPALALAAVLSLRRYPGERVIASLRARRTRRSPHTAFVRPRVRSRIAGATHGGRLIAASLAGRAPPAPLAGCRC